MFGGNPAVEKSPELDLAITIPMAYRQFGVRSFRPQELTWDFNAGARRKD